ncbi:MAG TPA: hypothetical protein VF625_15360 [Longimicrobium sp.]|jgi:hypothetical protein
MREGLVAAAREFPLELVSRRYLGHLPNYVVAAEHAALKAGDHVVRADRLPVRLAFVEPLAREQFEPLGRGDAGGESRAPLR